MHNLAVNEFGIECGRRSSARVQLGVPARIILVDGHVDGVLEDLSCTGARLASPRRLKAQENGLIRCGEMEAFFTVVWCNAGRCGVRFDMLQPAETVIGLRWIADNYPRIEKAQLEAAVIEWVQGRGPIRAVL